MPIRLGRAGVTAEHRPRGGCVRTLTAFATVGLATLGAAASAVASGWQLQVLPAVAVAPNGKLAAVSCSSAVSCVAVGSFIDRDGLRAAFGEHWDGGRWTLDSVPTPAGASNADLVAVSCPSAERCTAVGSYGDVDDRQQTLVERFDGTRWRAEPSPNPPGPGSTMLNGVSCASSASCLAVGRATTDAGGQTAVAERFDGTGWQLESVSSPPDSTGSALSAVSCTGPATCTAVGYSLDASDRLVALAARWDGKAWSIQIAAIPAGAKHSALDGVSCTTQADCIAVGYEVGKAGHVTLAEVWNGTSWAIQSSPDPQPVGGGASLEGVSCASAGDCRAVGEVDGVALAERLNGAGWELEAAPTPPGATAAALRSVACVSAIACTAVGDYRNGAGFDVTLAAAFDGASWTIQRSPDPIGATGAGFEGVSCPTRARCTAVGSYRATDGSRVPLAERSDGLSWTVQAAPNPRGATDAGLLAVSCPQPRACFAVGRYLDSAGTVVPLAEHWDGTRWSLQPTPAVNGDTLSILDAVSCTSRRACTAVGLQEAPGVGEVTLAERWDGSRWTVQSTANLDAVPGGHLDDVSCWSQLGCAATGGSQATARWDGEGWTADHAPIPTGAFAGVLSGLSCVGPSSCTAVGDYSPVPEPHPGLPLAEHWDGARWTIQPAPVPPVPAPAEAADSPLVAVSCSSTRSCTAVGDYLNGVRVVTLAEHWDGAAWQLQQTPNPAGGNAGLVSVSCTADGGCTAASASGLAVPAVERYTP